MKILYILAIELDSNSGPKIHAVEILEKLQKLGNDVLLLCPPFDKKRLKLSVKIKFYKFLGYSFFKRIVSYLFMFVSLLSCISKFKPTVVYERQMPYNPLVFFGCKIFKLPLFLEINGLFEEDLQHMNSSNLSILIHKQVEKKEFSFSKGLFCTSPVLKKRISKSHTKIAKKICPVPNGVNSNLFRPMDKRKCRIKLGFDPTMKYIGYVGSFNHIHNPEQGIKCFKRVADRIPDARLIMVGDGPRRKKCQIITENYNLSNKIIFVGSVSYNDVSIYINCFDVALDLSSELSLKRVGVIAFKFNEYLACGCPIIAQYLSTKDYNIFSSFVKMVHVNDKLGLSNSVIELLENPGSCAVMRKNALSYVKQNVSWEKSAILSLNFIREMLSDTKG